MNRRCTLTALALCLSFSVSIFAQEKGSPKPAGPTVAPPATVPTYQWCPLPLRRHRHRRHCQRRAGLTRSRPAWLHRCHRG
jgi:hypothetical protein